MSEDSSGSKKYWLRAIIIIAFGVPVLLEVLTFFNLIKFRLFDDGSSQNTSSPETITEVRKYAAGDTLFADSRRVITIEEMHIYVNPEAWDFELSLEASSPNTGSASPGAFTLSIDSLQLDNNSIIRKSALWEWESIQQAEEQNEESEHEENEWEWETEWTIPNGRLPTQLFISWRRTIDPDSTAVVHKTLAVEKPPIRYHN